MTSILRAFVLPAMLSVFGLTVAHAQSCKPANDVKTIAAGKLTVALYEYPPFASGQSGGGITGVDSDIVKRFAAANCLDVVSVVVDPSATIQYVLSGKSDVAIGDWYRTASREKVMGLSYPIYLDQMGIYSKTGEQTIQSLIGKKVGTISGFLWVAELQALLGANLTLYPNPVALAQDLAAGRVDIGVDGYSTGVFAQKRGGYAGIQIKIAEPDQRVQASIQAAQAAIVFNKSNPDFGKALSDTIEQLHKDGQLAQILVSYGLDASGADVGAPRLVQ